MQNVALPDVRRGGKIAPVGIDFSRDDNLQYPLD